MTIAGSDSGGGAGIQADLNTFAALGVHGVTAITCLTAQTPKSVRLIESVKPSMVAAQIESALSTFRPHAGKIGMLFSVKTVDAVIESLRPFPRVRLVVDPILVSSSGTALLRPGALRSFKTRLLPLATLITPNIPEAETLTGRLIREPEDMRAAARSLYESMGRAVLLKGGHGKEGRIAMDLFYDGREEYMLTLPRVRGATVHGTGCTLSAAITAGLARGESLLRAIQAAKEFTTEAIAAHRRVQGQRILGWNIRS